MLEKLRSEIDEIDDQLIELLEKRLACAVQVRAFKKASSDPAREQAILNRLRKRVGGNLGREFLERIFAEIFKESRALQDQHYPPPDTSSTGSHSGLTEERAISVPRIGLLGYGRFGRLWSELMSGFFKVVIHDPAHGFDNLEEIARSCDAIFFAVPISSFSDAVETTLRMCGERRPLFIDLLSVKSHPKQVFSQLLPSDGRALLLHPMFGPDSYGKGSACPIVMDRFRASPEEYEFWSELFRKLKLKLVELQAEEHDKLAASSQGLTHYIGRMLEQMNLSPSEIDTAGTRLLHQVKEQVCNDSLQLFRDLQRYNPYTLEMRLRLGAAQEQLYSSLLPDRIETRELVIGIQGGRGSFNEQAALEYLRKHQIADFRLVYLHTSENVLKALHEGRIDRGQFATHNSVGGIVHETIHALAKYTVEIVEEYFTEIRHSLMCHPECELTDIDTVMTHPQVLKQCATNLKSKYPQLRQTSGEGDLVDHAKVAEELAKGGIPRNIATMGSSLLAEINGLKILESDLQDAKVNLTSFLMVRRPIISQAHWGSEIG
jgi:prephenate dehydratase/prephenate dehydrogenase/chorismate mutase